VVGYAQVYDEEYDPNEDQDHPDHRGYHNRQSAIWPGGGYVGIGGIVGSN
jgi:hypothetical protein